MSEKRWKIQAKLKKNLTKMRFCVIGLWSDRRRLITKTFLAFWHLLNIGIDPKFLQNKFFSFLALFSEKFGFPVKKVFSSATLSAIIYHIRSP